MLWACVAAPNFNKPFKQVCDASDAGVGAVLLQEDGNFIGHPVSYFCMKLTPVQKNYSTILALQDFAVHHCSSGNTVTVFTDHHPLKYMNKFRDKNQQLTK